MQQKSYGLNKTYSNGAKWHKNKPTPATEASKYIKPRHTPEVKPSFLLHCFATTWCTKERMTDGMTGII